MKKLGKVLLTILLVIVVVVLAAVGGFKLYDWIAHKDFYDHAKPVFATPGVHEGFVQQGLDYVEEDETFLASGYMTDKAKSSRVYAISKDGEKVVYAELLKKNGEPFTGHAGGVVQNGDFVYVTYASKGNGGLAIFSYSDVLDGGTATQLGWIPTYVSGAHVDIHNGYLYAGSFYIQKDYETPQYERMVTPAGDQNYSIINVFKLDENAEFGVDTTKPVAVISSTRCVQGMCFTDDGKVILSTSYGLSTSQLFVYDLDKVTKKENHTLTNKAELEEGQKEFTFENVPLYYLDSGSLVETIKAPPMAEELACVDGRLYVMCESASNKYIFGKLTSGNDVYAYDMNHA